MTDGHNFSFPDASRGELDIALDDLVARARDVLKIQGRLRSLLKANQAIIGQLELPVVLEKIVAAAVELVGAKYGALGVVAPDGTLSEFIHVGMSDAEVRAIGHLPEGHGLLGALIDDPHPIRLAELTDDARSAGFPAHHPGMGSFLGVPVRVRSEVYGNLYLSNQSNAAFSDEDEQLVTALAATAGIAIENARLFAETHRRQAWSAATTRFAASLLSAEDGTALSTLAGRVLEIAEADIVWVLVPAAASDHLVAATARGVDEQLIEGRSFPIAGSFVAGVLEGGQPRQVNDGSWSELVMSGGRELGPVMAVPLLAPGDAHGVLVVARLAGGPRFALADLEMAADFAGQAGVAMALAAARADRQRMELLEDRGRIARDLHDHVIQQLFGMGLRLQGLATNDLPRSVVQALSHTVSDLDDSISQIRTAIFALSAPADAAPESVRHAVLDLATELGASMPSSPTVSFSGPVDLVVVDDLADDVIAVARECVTNIARHAQAQHSSISLAVVNGSVVLEVVDDGNGAQGSTRRSGVHNLEVRARARLGTFSFDSNDSGTRVIWSVPYDEVTV